VESVAQAELLVAATRYPPAGIRGAAFGVAHDDYEGGSVAAKIAAANQRVLVIALIETAAGVANVDAIAAVPGIDVLWLGHFDLTNSLGIPGQFEHPAYLDSVCRILDAAARHGNAVGVMAADDDWARRYLGMGFRAIAYGLDHQIFQASLARGISFMRNQVV
jgi:2-dehydro-3-deoxyglucarate aldolase/4-hydroxy-2-oxoheptanedioate aldolase